MTAFVGPTPTSGPSRAPSRRRIILPAMGGMGGRIWTALLAAGPQGASTSDLADAAYRGCAVPESFEASIRCQVQRLARAMAETHVVGKVRRGRTLFYIATPRDGQVTG